MKIKMSGKNLPEFRWTNDKSPLVLLGTKNLKPEKYYKGFN